MPRYHQHKWHSLYWVSCPTKHHITARQLVHTKFPACCRILTIFSRLSRCLQLLPSPLVPRPRLTHLPPSRPSCRPRIKLCSEGEFMPVQILAWPCVVIFNGRYSHACPLPSISSLPSLLPRLQQYVGEFQKYVKKQSKLCIHRTTTARSWKFPSSLWLRIPGVICLNGSL